MVLGGTAGHEVEQSWWGGQASRPASSIDRAMQDVDRVLGIRKTLAGDLIKSAGTSFFQIYIKIQDTKSIRMVVVVAIFYGGRKIFRC